MRHLGSVRAARICLNMGGRHPVLLLQCQPSQHACSYCSACLATAGSPCPHVSQASSSAGSSKTVVVREEHREVAPKEDAGKQAIAE